ncbi:uncharacterized protein V6R79_001561 [Siganus canaliculatus]
MLRSRTLMAMKDFKQFLVSLVAAVIFGLLSIIFVLIWVLYYGDGLAWNGGHAQFDLHPVLTVIGFIVLQGMAIIVYRLPCTWRSNKLVMKFIHATLNLLSLILAIISLVAVFDFHNASNMSNMFSLHGWLGLIAVILYCLQIVVGVGIYLIPITPVSWRAAFMPVHVYTGLFIFIVVIAVSLIGIIEILTGLKPSYSTFPPEGIFANFLGLILVVFGALVVWIVTRPAWKRPSDQILHTNESEDNSKVGSTMTQLSDGTEAKVSVDVRRRSIKLDDLDS